MSLASAAVGGWCSAVGGGGGGGGVESVNEILITVAVAPRVCRLYAMRTLVHWAGGPGQCVLEVSQQQCSSRRVQYSKVGLESCVVVSVERAIAKFVVCSTSILFLYNFMFFFYYLIVLVSFLKKCLYLNRR